MPVSPRIAHPRRGRRPGGAALVAALLLLTILVGGACTSGGGGEADPSGRPSEPAVTLDGGVEEAAAVLGAADLGDAATLDEVDRIRTSEEALAAAQEVLMSSTEDAGALWAAVYVYAAYGADPGPLVPLVDHPDPTIRLLAASGLLARGDRAGFQPVIAALGEDGTFAGSEPPTPLWSVAAVTLAMNTGRSDLGPPLDADPRTRALAMERWTRWLERSGDALTFDPGSGTWTTP